MATQKYDTHTQPQRSPKSSELGIHMHRPADITPVQREHMIAEAAYYLAEHRHFKGGDPVRDWLQAQREIDSKIKGTHN
jgi:hypothetical protein